jgi:molybdopterin-guanine dinucleotide biosynthesis protein A
MTRPGGIVLCGGRSSRMGRSKAWLPFGPELMLQRTVRIVRAVLDPVAVVAAPGQELPTLPEDVPVIRDEVEGRGPLQGLATGLQALQERADAVYLTSCDVPFLTAGFIQRVTSLLLESECSTAVPFVDGRFHPLAAAYRISILDPLRELMGTGRYAMKGLYDLVPTRKIEVHDLAEADLVSLRNVNTPEDYQAALRAISGEP